MRLDGRRESSNVEDRRGLSGGQVAGLGIGGLVIVGLISMLLGVDPSSLMGMFGGGVSTEQTTTQREFTEEEQALARFSKQILAGTEDVWTKIFKENGLKYTPPKMVLFTDAVQTACGGANSQVGPFYCSADQSLYIDLSFFSSMRQQLGADGDFAYAYVIAHEVGHHVEYLLGTLDKVHQAMSRTNEKEGNKLSVRLELLADFYAGVWAHHDNAMFGSLEEGDIEEAIQCAQVIGDDYLQKKARGYAVPESFNHGTSAQRMKWFVLGLKTGDVSQGQTFNKSDAEL